MGDLLFRLRNWFCPVVVAPSDGPVGQMAGGNAGFGAGLGTVGEGRKAYMICGLFHKERNPFAGESIAMEVGRFSSEDEAVGHLTRAHKITNADYTLISWAVSELFPDGDPFFEAAERIEELEAALADKAREDAE